MTSQKQIVLAAIAFQEATFKKLTWVDAKRGCEAALERVKCQWQPISTLGDYQEPILLLFSDKSGVQPARWGTYASDPNKEGWFEWDYGDEVDLESYEMWMPANFPEGDDA